VSIRGLCTNQGVCWVDRLDCWVLVLVRVFFLQLSVLMLLLFSL
jgi:hypothetical protein